MLVPQAVVSSSPTSTRLVMVGRVIVSSRYGHAKRGWLVIPCSCRLIGHMPPTQFQMQIGEPVLFTCCIFIELSQAPCAHHPFGLWPEKPFIGHNRTGQFLGLLARQRCLTAVISRDGPVVLAGIARGGVQQSRGSSDTARHEHDTEDED